MPYLYGPLTRLGLLVALAALAADQASKLWLLYVFDLGARGDIALMPFFALTLVWNTGISYGLFPQDGTAGQWVLLCHQDGGGNSAVDLAGTGQFPAYRQ